MSLLLLIDGYNVIPPVAPPGRGADADWLRRERRQLIERLSRHLGDQIRCRTCLVFDARQPPRDRSARYEVNEIQIRFAVGYPEADDLLEEIISAHSAAKQLAVVSSDHRVQAAAKRRGATAFDSDVWLDQLMDGKVRLSPSMQAKIIREGQGSGDSKPEVGDDVDRWMKEFGF